MGVVATPSSEPYVRCAIGPSVGSRVPLQRRCIPRVGVGGRPTLRPMHAGSILPRLEWARSYQRPALARDVFAGLLLTAILDPGRDGLRGGIRAARDRRAVRDHPAAAGLRAARSLADPGPRARLGAAADHRRGDRPARGRRRGARRRPGRAAGGPRRPDRHRGGVRPARVPDGSPVGARAAGLPQRHRIDHRHQPVCPGCSGSARAATRSSSRAPRSSPASAMARPTRSPWRSG